MESEVGTLIDNKLNYTHNDESEREEKTSLFICIQYTMTGIELPCLVQVLERNLQHIIGMIFISFTESSK